jgi:hypothetical protein
VDPCTALTPCRNGATCNVISDFNYTCACADGYAGRLCTDTTTLGFDGTSSMTVIVPQSADSISFSFQTSFREGVLVSQSDVWVLSLVDGKLKLKCMDSTECDVGEGRLFSDSNWHRVRVLYNGSSVSGNTSSGAPRCKDVCGASRTRRAVSSMQSKLVVGAEFVGSIRDFTVNDGKVYYPGTILPLILYIE